MGARRERMAEMELTPFEKGLLLGYLLATSPAESSFEVNDIADLWGCTYGGAWRALDRCRVPFLHKEEESYFVRYRFRLPGETDVSE